MYEAYYGLHEKPFALSPDPKFLFLSESHREVLGHLIYGIEQGEGFIAISGEVGTGKTTLCRTLLQRLGSESEVAFLFNPNLTPLELIKAINAEFELSTFGDSMPELIEVLNEFLFDRNTEGRRVLIIVDEAQNLSSETLEQVRLLSNLETSSAKLLQIVLLGQPELDDKLDADELRQLRQRISVWWHLGPLSAAETREYVKHRLRIAAGVDRPLFTDDALSLIHKSAGGVPRVINILCDRALLAGYGEELPQIDRATVANVVREVRPRSGARRAPRRWPLWAMGLTTLAAVLLAGILLLRGEQPRERPRAAATAPALHAAIPPVAAPAPRQPVAAAEEAPNAAPDPTRTPTAAATPPAIEGALQGLMPLRTLEATNASAVDALLRAWNHEPSGEQSLIFGDIPGALQQRGLEGLHLEGGGIDALRAADLPTIVLLRGEQGRTRSALLRRIGADEVDLEGLLPGRTVRVRLPEFEAHWRGEAIVAWRDFQALPSVIQRGDRGRPVIWLQTALADLGFYDGPREGLFDPATKEAVRAFQRSKDLADDGGVGARTKIRLYASLPAYVTPLLVDDSSEPSPVQPPTH